MFIKWEDGILYDTDFEEACEGYWISMATVYEYKNLNVAANLVRGYVWWAKKSVHMSIKAIHKENTPEKYKDEVEKYLLLI